MPISGVIRPKRSQKSRYSTKILVLNLDLSLNQRTNGPVNAHLRSASYTNKHI